LMECLLSASKSLAIVAQFDNWRRNSMISLELRQRKPIGV